MKDLNKIIATAIATGTIVASGAYGINRPECDYVIQHQGEEICISEEVKEAVSSQLKPNQGFGGVQFRDQLLYRRVHVVSLVNPVILPVRRASDIS